MVPKLNVIDVDLLKLFDSTLPSGEHPSFSYSNPIANNIIYYIYSDLHMTLNQYTFQNKILKKH